MPRIRVKSILKTFFSSVFGLISMIKLELKKYNKLKKVAMKGVNNA